MAKGSSDLAPRLLLTLASLLCMATAAAQPLPVSIDVSGNVATARIGAPDAQLADVTLSFDDAHNLSAQSLGVTAMLVDPADPAVKSRLPGLGLNIPPSLPLMITIEPPAGHGLNFRRTVQVEAHTHALAYTAGSRYRLFKAQLGGRFYDITTDVLPGSTRSRGSTGGFSQFIVLADLRPTDAVVDEKFDRLQAVVAYVPEAQAVLLQADLDAARDAVAAAEYATAIQALDSFRERVAADGGGTLSDRWDAAGSRTNLAGRLLAGAQTLTFSIGYLRDYGL